MLAKIYSAAVYGVDAYEVEIEVNGARGEPKIMVVEPIFSLSRFRRFRGRSVSSGAAWVSAVAMVVSLMPVALRARLAP